MYKVFFDDRKVFLIDNFASYFKTNHGLFYKYHSADDLRELIDFYGRLTRIENLFLFHHDIEELRNLFRSCFIPIDAAGGLVRNTAGEYLLMHRRGRWDLPKGKLSREETHDHAALREVEEECGISGLQIKQTLISTYHTYKIDDGIALKRTLWYEMLCSGKNEPKPQKEEGITEIRWVAAGELDYYLKQCFPAIRDVFVYYGV
jgi:8-oxo-dGTP pyrophosphatase MutT (NUDIX family)